MTHFFANASTVAFAKKTEEYYSSVRTDRLANTAASLVKKRRSVLFVHPPT